MARRRTAAQKLATARLVAGNIARRTGSVARTIVVAAPRAYRTVARRVGPRIERAEYLAGRIAPRGSRRRRAIGALVSGGSAVSIAQAKGLPGAVGGYVVGYAERNQRVAAAAEVNKVAGAKGALIKDPTYRLAAMFAGLALVASKTQGFVRDAAIGGMGGIGTLYQMYTSDSSPVDNYLTAIKNGSDGITTG